MKKTIILCSLLLLVAPLAPLVADNSNSCDQYYQQYLACTENNSFYRTNFKITDLSFFSQYKGRIIMRAEGKGETYYVNPGTKTLNYLGNSILALKVMKDSSLGITNKNLERIPVGITKLYGTDSDADGLTDNFEEAIGTDPFNFNSDGDRWSDKIEITNHYDPNGPGKLPSDTRLVNRLKGRVLMQVESAGELWYLNPLDGKRYLISNQFEMSDLVKNLAFGVSNWTFAQIVK